MWNYATTFNFGMRECGYIVTSVISPRAPEVQVRYGEPYPSTVDSDLNWNILNILNYQ